MISRNDDSNVMTNPLIVDCQGDLVEALPSNPVIHPEILNDLPTFSLGDLVSTCDNRIGLVIDDLASDGQGIMFYRIMIGEEEMYYSVLQLKKISGDNK
jgi:hypothetical protein